MRVRKDLSEGIDTLSTLKNIVSSEMCVGCGLCIAQDNSQEAEMSWNDNGFLVPNFDSVTEIKRNSLSVCPFNPIPEKEVRTEDELAETYLKDGTKYYPKLGRLINTYVGYSKKFRQSSSSGGLGTYVIKKLLDSQEVDCVFVVSEGMDNLNAYQYQILDNSSDITKSSKTRYYPVSMAEVFKKLQSIKGPVAIVGIPCFIKAIRLHQYYNPDVASKIRFLVGIVCGGMKSRFFTEYLVEKSGVESRNFSKPEFRVKDLQSSALDYSFSCKDQDDITRGIKMRQVGDMWGTGYFKNNACDFCDDVVAELADISLGDAWIDPYKNDGAGTNIVITRSRLAEKIINEGIINKDLMIEELSIEQVIQSQEGGFNHRHKGLLSRIQAVGNKFQIPPKRYDKENAFIDFKMVQKQRMKVREATLTFWRNHLSVIRFEEELKSELDKLQFYTKIYHRLRRLKKIVSKIK